MPQGNEGAEGQVPLPRHPDDVTPEWLTAALRSRGRDVTVQSFRRSGVGEGIGMMSGLERLEVEYATGTGPPVIVLKMPARNDANRAVAEAFHLYEREVLFYRDVAPRSAARTPEVYYADLDGSDFVLLLEDLSDYRLGDQVQGCSLEDSRLGMVWLGKHHASFWDDVGDPSLDFMPDIWPSYSSDALQQGGAYGWDPMVEAFDDILPDHIRSLKERYLAAAPRLFEWMASAPLTVVHGDFRMDNLFFGTGDDQEPLIALDWQGCLRGRAAQDIGYFMSGSIPIELRRAHERELIGLWHQHARGERRDRVLAGGRVGELPARRPLRVDHRRRDRRDARPHQRARPPVDGGDAQADGGDHRRPRPDRAAWPSSRVARPDPPRDDLSGDRPSYSGGRRRVRSRATRRGRRGCEVRGRGRGAPSAAASLRPKRAAACSGSMMISCRWWEVLYRSSLDRYSTPA